MGKMGSDKREADAFQAVLEGTASKASRRVIDLATLAVSLEPASRPGPDPRFRERLRNELMAAADQSAEDAFAAMVEGSETIVLDEVVPLAKLANAMASGAQRSLPAPAFRYQLRSTLIAQAENGEAGWLKARAASLNARMRRSLRFVGATGIAASLMLGSGAALAAARNAVPGDGLYGLKRAHERAQHWASSGVARGTLDLRFARTRLREVRHLATEKNPRVPLYVGALDDMDAETIEGTTILIDEFRAHGTRNALQRVVAFSKRQASDLAGLMNLVPVGARAAMEDSLDVAQRAGRRVELVLQGCPCPSNALEQQPASGTGTGVGCGCSSPTSGASDPATGQTGTSQPGGDTTPGPGPQPSPQPDGSFTDQIPDVPGTDVDDQIKDIVDPLVPTPSPTLPIVDPSGLPTDLPTALPTGVISSIPTLP